MEEPAELVIEDTPVGPLSLRATECGLISLAFLTGQGIVPSVTFPPGAAAAARVPGRNAGGDGPARRALARAAVQLEEYFRGARRAFDLRPALGGLSVFDREVLGAALSVPYGQLVNYGELARRIGRPGAARAVGGALGRNPLPIFIPCHRIVAANAGLGGFTAGLGVKRTLLGLEGLEFASQAI